MARELKEGKQGYEDRRDNYTLQEAIMLLKELEETKNNNPWGFTGEVVAFYATCVNYTEM